jgi:hypothetical protein
VLFGEGDLKGLFAWREEGEGGGDYLSGMGRLWVESGEVVESSKVHACLG